MGLVGLIYNGIAKRTSTLVLTMTVGALFFERGLDWTAEAIFQEVNKGKLWKDIKHKYEVAQEEEE